MILYRYRWLAALAALIRPLGHAFWLFTFSFSEYKFGNVKKEKIAIIHSAVTQRSVLFNGPYFLPEIFLEFLYITEIIMSMYPFAIGIPPCFPKAPDSWSLLVVRGMLQLGRHITALSCHKNWPALCRGDHQKEGRAFWICSEQTALRTWGGVMPIMASHIFSNRSLVWLAFVNIVPLIVVFQLLSHPTLCDPMDCSTPGFPALHCLPEFAQTHVHWVDDAIQPSHPL